MNSIAVWNQCVIFDIGKFDIAVFVFFSFAAGELFCLKIIST